MPSRPSRRWLITRGAAGGAPAAFGAVVAACGGKTQQPTAAPTTWTIGSASVPTGGAVVIGQRSLTPVWVVSPSPGRYVGLSGVCPHNDCPVQFDASVRQFGCPCHGSVFDGFSGAVLQGPATDPLARISVVQRGEQLVVGPFAGPEAAD